MGWDNKMTNQPTRIGSNGTKFWEVDGKLHRTDGPAIEYFNGSKEWYIDGKLHRTDGPAIDWANGKMAG